jgi:hypothetical protein
MNKQSRALFAFLTLVFTSSYADAQVFTQSGTGSESMPNLERSADFTPYPRREAQVIKSGLLAPSETDIAAHQVFLSQPKTGLIRLMPRESYDWEVYNVAQKLKMRGGGAYYSFHYGAHRYGYGSDLSLDHGNLMVGFAGADYGMLTDLGSVALEEVDIDDPRVTFMLNYRPSTKEAEVRLEAQKFFPNLIVDGVTYLKQIRSEVNHTYLLRSFVFDRSDVLVALRVARQEDDGSVIIAWKLLKEFSAPKLSRQQAH